MGTNMNSDAYRKLIDEDLEWLNKQPRTLEREHIKQIVEDSINLYYPHLVENLAIHDVVDSACFDYVDGINMDCAKCGQPKYRHK